MTSNYVEVYPVFIKKIKKGIVSSENMKNTGNYNYDNAHSFFGKDF